jgi:hypothetical protein
MRLLERFFKILDTLITSGLFANIFLVVALGASMNRVWSMLNTIQIVSHVTLLAVSLPSNVGICLSSIVDTSNVQLVPKAWVDMVLYPLRSWSLDLNDAASGIEDRSFTYKIREVIFVYFVLAGVILLIGLLHLVSIYSLR